MKKFWFRKQKKKQQVQKQKCKFQMTNEIELNRVKLFQILGETHWTIY